MILWLSCLFQIRGFLANNTYFPAPYLYKRGNNKFLSDTTIFKEAVGILADERGVFGVDSSSVICLAVLHFERYLGLGRF
jgi:hypothetical protein